MRALTILAALAAMTVAAQAGCVDVLLGQTPVAFLGGFAARMIETGITDILPAGERGGRKQFALVDSKISVFLAAEDGMLKEVNFVVSSDLTPGEQDRELTAASYAVSRITGQPEQTVKDALGRAVRHHDDGEWLENLFGATVAVTKECS